VSTVVSGSNLIVDGAIANRVHLEESAGSE
jgi:hypothetical protein